MKETHNFTLRYTDASAGVSRDNLTGVVRVSLEREVEPERRQYLRLTLAGAATLAAALQRQATPAPKERALAIGMALARKVFEKRGDHSEAHLNEAELAAALTLAAEVGAGLVDLRRIP
jgi:hypothetical protein